MRAGVLVLCELYISGLIGSLCFPFLYLLPCISPLHMYIKSLLTFLEVLLRLYIPGPASRFQNPSREYAALSTQGHSIGVTSIDSLVGQHQKYNFWACDSPIKQ